MLNQYKKRRYDYMTKRLKCFSLILPKSRCYILYYTDQTDRSVKTWTNWLRGNLPSLGSNSTLLTAGHYFRVANQVILISSSNIFQITYPCSDESPSCSRSDLQIIQKLYDPIHTYVLAWMISSWFKHYILPVMNDWQLFTGLDNMTTSW